jgi:hypothetical protein
MGTAVVRLHVQKSRPEQGGPGTSGQRHQEVQGGRQHRANELGLLCLGRYLYRLGESRQAESYLSQVSLKWTGAENSSESAIKAELLRCRLAILKSAHPQKDTAERLEEIANIAVKQGLRELASEIYHALGTFYQKLSDEKTSAEYVSKAKDIIDDIVGTLSEEYRDSFLRQQFRKTVSEDSIRLEKSLSHLNLEEEIRR